MPFPLALSVLEDSKFFSDIRADSSIQKEVEGGIFITRRRFTRLAPRTLTTGFTGMPDADFQALQQFYSAVFGSGQSWIYTHPTTNESLTVNFAQSMTNIYAGIGASRMWDVTQITLRTSF